MSCISSHENRFYVHNETTYGQPAAITAANRIPAVQLKVKQTPHRVKRRDKTGSRTHTGLPAGIRKQTDFELTTYMTGWAGGSTAPAYGPLFEASLGAAVSLKSGRTVASSTTQGITFAAAHGLAPGDAVSFGGEIRFVTSIPGPTAVNINAPFSIAPTAGTTLGNTAGYKPATELPSFSIFDYWGPATTVQRVIRGAAINKMRIDVNADFHQFSFSGAASDVVDSASFSTGQIAGLTQFPAEPALADFSYSIIPGHLGQAWIGTTPTQFLTVTSAVIEIDNGLDLRANEFGTNGPTCVVAGERKVSMNFSLYSMNDDATKQLYQAARQRSPVSVMIQLGQQSGQLFGAYMNNVTLEVPEFDDKNPRLQWNFVNCRAQGTADDELFLAFA